MESDSDIESSIKPNPGSGVAPHVLVVDDDDAMRGLIREYLGDYGFRVSGVPDGEAMRRALQTSVIDVIVLDLKLPSEDGMSIARELRAKSDIPIVIITGRQAAVDRIMGLELELTTI